MMTAVSVAKYISKKYKEMFHEQIGEMKLHKLLYLSQREALIENNKPLFLEEFQGWRFGPVLPTVRNYYDELVNSENDIPVDISIKKTIDTVLRQYGAKDPWSLSRLTHGEYSWQKSRIGLTSFDNGNRWIPIDDIRVDAERIRTRRMLITQTRDNESAMRK